MFKNIKRTFTVFGLGALCTLVVKRLLHLRGVCSGARNIDAKDSCNNTFDGTFQPAFFNINVNIDSHNK